MFNSIPSLPRSRSGAGVLCVAGSCLSLQFGATIAHSLFPAAGPWGVTAVRLAIAAVILLALARPAVRSWGRDTWVSVALLGITLGAMNGFFYAAIARLPLGVAVTIEFLGPLLLAAALSRRAVVLGWVALALGGIALLGLDSFVTAEALDPLGVAFVLCAGAMWACYILAGAKASSAAPGMEGLAVAFAIGAAVNAVPGAVGAAHIVTTPSLFLPALLTGVLGSLVPYSLELLALRRLSRPVFGVLLSLEPVFACIVGWIMLGQALSPLQWVAVAAVIVATTGNTLGSRGDAEGTNAGDGLPETPVDMPEESALGLPAESPVDFTSRERRGETADSR